MTAIPTPESMRSELAAAIARAETAERNNELIRGANDALAEKVVELERLVKTYKGAAKTQENARRAAHARAEAAERQLEERMRPRRELSDKLARVREDAEEARYRVRIAANGPLAYARPRTEGEAQSSIDTALARLDEADKLLGVILDGEDE